MSHKIDFTSISPLPLTPRSSATRHRQSFFHQTCTPRIEKFQRNSRYEPLDRLKVYLTLTFYSKDILAIGKQLYLNKVTDIIKFEKHFLNSTTDTQSLKLLNTTLG